MPPGDGLPKRSRGLVEGVGSTYKQVRLFDCPILGLGLTSTNRAKTSLSDVMDVSILALLKSWHHLELQVF